MTLHRMDDALLRHAALSLVGLLILAGGLTAYVNLDSIASPFTAALPKLQQLAPETVAPVQSLVASIGAYKTLSLVASLIGAYVLFAGAYSIYKRVKNPSQPNVEYYQPPA